MRAALEGSHVRFHCPGCGYDHAVNVDVSKSPSWSWNDDAERPTITPSVLNRTGRAVIPSWPEWEDGDPPLVCHIFVTEGSIQYLDDCTHHLAGRTIELPPVDA